MQSKMNEYKLVFGKYVVFQWFMDCKYKFIISVLYPLDEMPCLPI